MTAPERRVRVGYIVNTGKKDTFQNPGRWVFWKKKDAEAERRAYSRPRWPGKAIIVKVSVEVVE